MPFEAEDQQEVHSVVFETEVEPFEPEDRQEARADKIPTPKLETEVLPFEAEDLQEAHAETTPPEPHGPQPELLLELEDLPEGLSTAFGADRSAQSEQPGATPISESVQQQGGSSQSELPLELPGPEHVPEEPVDLPGKQVLAEKPEDPEQLPGPELLQQRDDENTHTALLDNSEDPEKLPGPESLHQRDEGGTQVLVNKSEESEELPDPDPELVEPKDEPGAQVLADMPEDPVKLSDPELAVLQQREEGETAPSCSVEAGCLGEVNSARRRVQPGTDLDDSMSGQVDHLAQHQGWAQPEHSADQHPSELLDEVQPEVLVDEVVEAKGLRSMPKDVAVRRLQLGFRECLVRSELRVKNLRRLHRLAAIRRIQRSWRVFLMQQGRMLGPDVVAEAKKGAVKAEWDSERDKRLHSKKTKKKRQKEASGAERDVRQLEHDKAAETLQQVPGGKILDEAGPAAETLQLVPGGKILDEAFLETGHAVVSSALEEVERNGQAPSNDTCLDTDWNSCLDDLLSDLLRDRPQDAEEDGAQKAFDLHGRPKSADDEWASKGSLPAFGCEIPVALLSKVPASGYSYKSKSANQSHLQQASTFDSPKGISKGIKSAGSPSDGSTQVPSPWNGTPSSWSGTPSPAKAFSLGTSLDLPPPRIRLTMSRSPQERPFSRVGLADNSGSSLSSLRPGSSFGGSASRSTPSLRLAGNQLAHSRSGSRLHPL
eukprot:TRINITY_DN11658_c0_g1_i3.p1 TRINITY_DN11658_c0_g1~~TRINITY_DN11658_c0_g1_i3.p1  ORF type:complete len:714 (-),score=177.01 TRINITY_DN11658_c0_g1_i3:103-2244(-)